MVGKFGEVQVMDWGLAKVINPDEPTEPELHKLLKSIARALFTRATRQQRSLRTLVLVRAASWEHRHICLPNKPTG
jgi:hypothetical protein